MSALAGPQELSAEERAAVEAFLETLADDEFVVAERYTEWQVRGPTLEADIAIANIAQDEYGHARLWYDLLMDFGYEEPDLIWERSPDEFRHSTLVEQPFARGDWADAVCRTFLYDSYEHLLLEALADSSYPRIRDRVAKVQGEEAYHREHAQNWLERLCESEDGKTRVQDALDRLFPHALTLFAPTEEEDAIVELGIRPVTLPQLQEDWLAVVTPFFESLDLDVPDAQSVDLPAVRGRDGSHTNSWRKLYNEFTYTYELLDRSEARRLMRDPDDV
ncbi:1,2-phenylacetyl-CoA epoxidase subunit PaaC [Natronomonas sp. EA1]|uniref:1,2-phenylacetyl-CoA epoxidase subunit PaaC n=1 Tax=Natronomonas sp. EA1 TaxID=3421655 RepID=UPI003EBA783E